MIAWVELLDGLSASARATLWTAGIAMMATTSCALVGSYLVLRRMGLLGDAISHAVLPGLVIGFMVSGSRALWPMLIGAAAAGLATTFLSELLRRRARVEASAGMGVVFTSLFALGVVLISTYGKGVDLDAGCVLYGALEYRALDTVTLAQVEVPRSFLALAAVALVDLGLVLLLWKELKISSFDPALATTLGIPAGFMHYFLMAMVSCTTVACFEAVGSILVIAMLIVPGATAHLLTDRLSRMLGIAVVVGWLSAIAGILLARRYNTNEAGMMAVAAGAQLGLAVLLAPRHGVLARAARGLRFSFRIIQEDYLARLYRLEEAGAARGAAESGRSGAGLRERFALSALAFAGAIESAGSGWALTANGRRRAEELVRSHRLWESFLADRLGLPADHLHEPAHRMEHYVSPELAEQLRTGLASRAQDPHGRTIPPP